MSFCFLSKSNVNLFSERIIIEVKVSYRLVAYSQLTKTPWDFFGYNSGYVCFDNCRLSEQQQMFILP